MKRDSTSLDDIADWYWLCECACRAARGKRHRNSVQHYFAGFESHTGSVRQALLSGRLPHGSYRGFMINDPKPRLIHAAPFADRVAHHAIIGKLALRFERAQSDSSYACRPGKGVHSAIAHARRVARRSPWLLKMDVHSYFAQIDHQCLKGLLSRLFKNHDLLMLLYHIIDGYHTRTGCGLPIGALTSQYFANHYLDGVQRHIREETDAIDELRYMDDLWVGCQSKAAAQKIATQVKQWLRCHRKLTLKPALIQRSQVGLPFCGFSVSRRRLIPGKRRKQSVRMHFKRIAAEYQSGLISERECQSQLHSAIALLTPGVHSRLAGKIIANSGINALC